MCTYYVENVIWHSSDVNGDFLTASIIKVPHCEKITSHIIANETGLNQELCTIVFCTLKLSNKA